MFGCTVDAVISDAQPDRDERDIVPVIGLRTFAPTVTPVWWCSPLLNTAGLDRKGSESVVGEDERRSAYDGQ